MSASSKQKLNRQDFITLIPLRGGSKGIPKKNLRALNNSPLYHYVVNASLNAQIKTFISTEDPEIKEDCKKSFSTVQIIDRPIELAKDNSTTEDVIEHFLDIEPSTKHIVLLQATSPLTKSEEITMAISKYIKHSYLPLISVIHEHSFLWNKEGQPINYDPFNRPRRQDWEGIYRENGAIYIFSKEHFDQQKSRASSKCTLYEMNKETLFEIDDFGDLEIVSSFLKKKL